MKRNNFKIYITGVLATVFAFTSCVKDLDTVPLDKDEVTSVSVYTADLGNYTMVLAKLYAGLAVSGQEGPSGNNDLSGLDEGFGQYLRAYWYAQELPTDEAIIAWNDGNLRDYHEQDWSASNEFITNMYYRIFYQVALCNEFIRETTSEKLSDRGVADADKATIATYVAEARFLRALSYWHALDLFGNVPFVTEEDNVGSFFPEQISRANLFTYIETELLAVETLLVAPMANDYARADQAAVWMLLAKLYLNAEVYLGTGMYTEALIYLNKTINAGYTLEPTYANLFLADNDNAEGVIFPITSDGINTRTWGGTTFIIHAAVGGSMAPADFGIDGGWAGLRTTKSLVGKFLNLDLITKGAPLTKGPYPEIWMPGSHNGWSHDVANTLGSINSDDNYEGYQWLVASDEFKFTLAANWDDNFGDDGADGTLDQNGANITPAEDGFFKINVDIAGLTYTLTKTDWGIIGSATPDDWNSDQNMEFDPATGEWLLIIELKAGEMKFRANDDWGLNYGDNDADGTLEEGGTNIAITEAGKYEVKLFLSAPDYTWSIAKYSTDERALLYADGQSLEITDVFEFTEGYAISKFKNVTSTGSAGSHPTFVDTDFPLFRIADAYLMYAESVLRGGSGGDAATALGYINDILTRAYGDANGNITAGELTLDFILDERARELLWEAHRRTDLVRFGKFSNSDYLWAWKGGVADGVAVDSKYDLYPIPSSDVGANPNLVQNFGY